MQGAPWLTEVVTTLRSISTKKSYMLELCAKTITDILPLVRRAANCVLWLQVQVDFCHLQLMRYSALTPFSIISIQTFIVSFVQQRMQATNFIIISIIICPSLLPPSSLPPSLLPPPFPPPPPSLLPSAHAHPPQVFVGPVQTLYL